ncbi:MAG: type II secretion system F family protein [Acidobacteriota bacterium]|jgi:tight adherence protein C|nr:type II secretion system F family protein [Acidobacteriaceae bacterium]
MSPEVALAGGFFLLVLALVGGGGYWYLQRRESSGQDDGAERLLAGTLEAFGAAVPARDSQAERYRKLLRYAGFRRPEALSIFYGAKAATSVALGTLAAVGSLLLTDAGVQWLVALLAGGGLGYLLTDRVLVSLGNRRAERLKRSLPLALELLVLALESGQSLDGAMLDTARELESSHPDLARELASVPPGILSTRSRQDQLRQLLNQNKEPEIRRFAQVLLDSDRFGTSLAAALRNQTRYLRTSLRQQAQEQARKVSVKLVFPVFFLIFPAVLLVTLGPAVLQLMDSLQSGFGNVIR